VVYKLRPLQLAFEFEDWPYHLGDTIDLIVDLDPSGDVAVREVRVGLECQQRYWESSTLTMEVPIITHDLTGGEGVAPPRQTGTDTVVKQVTREHKETFVHSSVLFLKDEKLRAGPRAMSVKLEIEQVPPPHASEVRELIKDPDRWWSFRWILVAMVNVVRGLPRRRVAAWAVLE